MKLKSFQFILVGMVIVAAVGSFFSTRAQMFATGSFELDRWLGLSSRQRQSLDETNRTFAEEAQELTVVYQGHRQKLARLFADPNSSEESIRNQVQIVLESNNTLLRCVVGHILDIREHLTEDQCRQFTGLCYGAMCGQGRGRWAQSGRKGRGYGYGARNGMGRGRGRGARFGRHLAFTAEQEATVTRLDPNFVVESEQLTERMQQRHQGLSQLLEDPQADSPKVLEQLALFMNARSQFEQRTMDHLLRIRHLLTPNQMQQLLGLCETGHRRRRGWSFEGRL